MRCPNCSKEMKYTFGTERRSNFSGTDDDYEIYWEKYRCKECRITYLNDEWEVPIKLRPTEKQKRTILFINNRLRLNLAAITKNQCWQDINKHFEKAKEEAAHISSNFEDYSDYSLAKFAGNMQLNME